MQKFSRSALKATHWLQAGVVATGFALASASPASALSFVFDYTYDSSGFFAQQARKDTLQAAAGFFEARITDQLSAITPGGSNTWTTSVFNPGGGSNISVSNLTIAADTLLIYAGGYDLGGSTLGLGGPGGYSAGGSPTFFDSITRGQTNASGTSATDVGIWGGSIAFDTLASDKITPTNWNFDINNGPTAGQNDFLSVAIHELGHVLGFGTSDSWNTYVTAGKFTGPSSVALYGSSIPLGSDADHWLDGTSSTLSGTAQETAMDPSITTGTRKLFTDLDFAALKDIGWEVQPAGATAVPTPPLLLGVIGLGAKLWSKRRREVAA
jgi:hypothetical protein